MPSVCMYFQVHQPERIRRYSFFNGKHDYEYFDDTRNREIIRKVAKKCYLPANETLLSLIRKHEGAFRVAFSITGTALDQMKRFAPEVVESFVELADTGCVEFLGETYYHSLAALYDPMEFKEQVQLHSDAMEETFGQRPVVFRNTELIHQDFIGHLVSEMDFKAILAEAADDVLGWRSPNYLYRVPDSDTKILLRNYRLSDDIAFRFSNRSWQAYPLTAEKFAHWVHRIDGFADVINLFMDYETFGEHQWKETGIFDFLAGFPGELLKNREWSFYTPSQVAEKYSEIAELSFDRLTSWADLERDLSAWRGNRMQISALQQAYDLGRDLKASRACRNNSLVMDVWRKLLTSDHFYYMCTKWKGDGDVHSYFSPFDNPYEAFVNYVNIIKDCRQRWLGERPQAQLEAD